MMCLALHALSRVRLSSVDNVNRRCVHQSVTGLPLIEVSGNPWRDLTLLIPMWVLNTSSTPTFTGAIEIHGRDRKNENERQFFRDPFFSDQAAALCRTSLETIPVQNPGERDSGLIVYRVVLRRLRGSIQIPSYDLEWARV